MDSITHFFQHIEGLSEFQSQYFPYPLYRDESLSFYSALGTRKMGLKTYNPFKIWKDVRGIGKRLKAKNIDGNYVGEGYVQGGIIVFDKNGEARYAYREDTGEEVPVNDVVAAARMVRSANA